MRRAVLIALALGLLGGGLYIAAAQLAWSDLIASRAMMAAGFMICLGGWLLWDDLVAPRLGRTKRQ